MIREATEDDWPAISALFVELGRPDVRGRDDHREAFRQYLQRDDAVALVAQQDGQVVGFLDMEFRDWLTHDAEQAWVPDLIVSERMRGKGFGAALLARAEELARQRGCWAITLESANWRTDAHRFYEREGFTDFGKSFAKSLS